MSWFMEQSSTRLARLAAIFSSVLQLLTAAAGFLGYIIFGAKDQPNEKDYPAGKWDPDYLRAMWKARRSTVDLEIATIFFFTIALFMGIYAIVVVKRMYKEERGFTRHALLYCFVGGATLGLIGWLQFLGLSVGARSISEDSSLPDQGVIALTVAYELSGSLFIFLDAVNFAMISLAILAASWLSYTAGGDIKHRLSIRHGVFGAVVGFVGLLIFFIEIIFLMANSTNTVLLVLFGFLAFLWTLILLPVWTVWLGIQMGSKEIPDGSSTSHLIGSQQL